MFMSGTEIQNFNKSLYIYDSSPSTRSFQRRIPWEYHYRSPLSQSHESWHYSFRILFILYKRQHEIQSLMHLTVLSTLLAVASAQIGPCNRINQLINDRLIPNQAKCTTQCCKDTMAVALCKARVRRERHLLACECPLSSNNCAGTGFTTRYLDC